MTREAVSAAKPAVRAQAKTEKVHGAASAAVLKGLVYGAAVLTFAVLLFLIGYILVTGIPHLKPSLFQWNYTSENVSMMPAILTTVETTALALLLAVPLGLFTAVYLNEYAKRGNKLVNVIRITTETLSGIPSIGFLPRRLVRSGRRTSAHGIPHRAACCGSRHPVRCYPRYRPHRR